MKKFYLFGILILSRLPFPGAIQAQVCSSPGTTIYGLTGAAGIYPITVSNAATGAKINPAYPNPAPNQANAIGYNSINGKFYYFKINPGVGGQQFFSYDPTLNVYTTLATSPITVSVHSGCVTWNGAGYYCTDINGNLFYYNILLNTWTTITSNIVDQNNNNVSTVIQSQSAGDMATDGHGNLWFVTSSSSNYGLYEIKTPVPTTATATVTCTKIIDPSTATPGGSSFAGMAFSTTGQVYLSTITGDDKLYLLQSNLTLSYIGTFTVSGVGNDLTSCNFPLTVLPVIWQSFSAQLQSNGQVLLSWVISKQVQNKGFGVEYSRDGNHWEELVFIPDAGGQQEETSYSYIHPAPFPGKNFYRIRQVDFNGSQTWSETRTIDIQSNVVVSCSPNPARDMIQVHTNSSMLGATLRIFDQSGRPLRQSILTGETSALNIGSLPAGLYIVHIQSVNGDIRNARFTKL